MDVPQNYFHRDFIGYPSLYVFGVRTSLLMCLYVLVGIITRAPSSRNYRIWLSRFFRATIWQCGVHRIPMYPAVTEFSSRPPHVGVFSVDFGPLFDSEWCSQSTHVPRCNTIFIPSTPFRHCHPDPFKFQSDDAHTKKVNFAVFLRWQACELVYISLWADCKLSRVYRTSCLSSCQLYFSVFWRIISLIEK